MCGLCGLLGVSHWTETAAHPDAFGGSRRRTVRAERLHRARLVNAALAPARLRLTDFQGAHYVLTSATGRREVVSDIQAVWGAVERLRGAPVDPLDPAYLARLREAGR